MAKAKQSLIKLTALLAMSGTAHSQTLNWGMEATHCGNNQFYIAVGNGSDVYLNSINGTVSATSLVADTTTERQVLISIAGDTPVHGTVTANPSLPGYNHEVNQGLYVADVKQIGTSVVHFPFNVVFPKPVLIPRGAFATNFFIATYDPVGTPLSGPCLDAEVHVQLVWQASP
jgi:hypothetical protein